MLIHMVGKQPEAEHVRASVDTGLDALEDVLGIIDDPDLPDDIAEHHDRYLYGAKAAFLR